MVTYLWPCQICDNLWLVYPSHSMYLCCIYVRSLPKELFNTSLLQLLILKVLHLSSELPKLTRNVQRISLLNACLLKPFAKVNDLFSINDLNRLKCLTISVWAIDGCWSMNLKIVIQSWRIRFRRLFNWMGSVDDPLEWAAGVMGLRGFRT